MNLYRLKTSKNFVGTQADAKQSGEEWEAFECPTDKAGLLETLNSLVDETQTQEAPQPAEPEASVEKVTPAERIVTQNLDGKDATEFCIQKIMSAHVLTLGRFASAVSLRYNDLSKRKRK